MKFKVTTDISSEDRLDTVYLEYIHYDDYGYCTNFKASYLENSPVAKIVQLGYLKISCVDLAQHVTPGTSRNGYNSYSVLELMPKGYFEKLPEQFFSLGEDISYYRTISQIFNRSIPEYCASIQDLAFYFERFEVLYKNQENSLINSLMRSLHYPNVEQFNRIINGEAELTEYQFSFVYNDEEISIEVNPTSLPPSNIHVLIGRNGVGKTWLLYQMMHRILAHMGLDLSTVKSNKYTLSDDFALSNNSTAFAGAIGVSFSIFDDAFSSIAFNSSFEQMDNHEKNNESTRLKDEFHKKYKYIGLALKDQDDGRARIKSVDDMTKEFTVVLEKIEKSHEKKCSYLEMCDQLRTDPMFSDNGFVELLNNFCLGIDDKATVRKQFKRLSSGHMIIILSLTLLCESIFEKTIVLIDEPEMHLHPPLISTYIRTLSFLLRKKNAVAIIATHSPIVVQEVPSHCVSKIERIQETMYFSRPIIESFAANTDSLTRDIFGYEVIKTGFYKLLEDEIGDSFEETFQKFNEQIGFMGQIMIQRLIKRKEDIANEET